MTRVARGLAFVLLLVAPSFSHALDPKRALTQYVRQIWRVSDGLPASIVYSIAQTRDGYLWLGTSAGVARFDGESFQVFDRHAAGLPANTVWSVVADSDGTLWAGTTDGLAHLVNGRFETFTTNDGLTDRFVQTMLLDRRGRLWLGTAKGLSIRENGRIRAASLKQPLISGSILGLFEDHTGRVWVGGKDMLASFDPDFTMQTYGPGDGLPPGRVRTFWEDDARALWMGADGWLTMDNGRVVKKSPTALTMAAIRDRDGNLWAGSARDGLSRRHGEDVATLGLAQGLPASWVQALFEDREGSVWVGLVGGGVMRLKDGGAVTFGGAEGLPTDRTAEVIEDANGDIWISTVEGLVRRSRDRFVIEPLAGGQKAVNVTVLVADPSGGVWVSREGEEVIDRVGGGQPKTYRVPAPGDPWAFAAAKRGGLWIAGQNGLFHFLDGKLTPTGVDETVSTVLEEDDGTLWIGTPADGLRRLRDGTLTKFTSADGLPSSSIHRLYRDAGGALWFGTPDAGLVLFRNGRFHSFGAREGLADSVCAVIEDEIGSFWISSLRGIFRVPRSQLLDVADGKVRALSPTLLDAWDGVRNPECRRGALRARDGRLWFTTGQGVVLIDPAHLPASAAAPVVHIERVAVNGLEVNRSSFRIAPAGIDALELRYAAATLADPRQVRFRYRLDGYDRDWIDAGNRRNAEYRKLPFGDYVFRAVAVNDDGALGNEAATLSFSVAPHIHETWWARSLGVAALAGSLFFGVGLRVRSLRRRAADLEVRQRELERVVGERTEELRGTVSQLERAQDQLARLSAASPEKLENVAAWADSMAREIARTIGARQIGIWSLHGSEMRPVVTGTTLEPDIEDLRSALGGVATRENADARVIPVPGMSGELRGGLVVEGAARWGEMEQRLVAGFAQHLGSALDLRRLREQLTQTEERQAATRQRMREEGIAAVLICPTCRRCYEEGTPRCGEDDSALDDSLLLPFRLEHRYRLSSLLGQGGMGSVFRAQDEKLGRSVAIKLIRAERLADSVIRFRFEREAHTLAQLRHPSVAALFDSGELADGSAFLVMELLSGRDLAQILAKHGPGSPSEVARLLQHAGAGLSSVHRAGVVHRDVKPANLILVPDASGFETKVVDFGLAAAGQIDARVTHAGTVLGTPAYMSPEQAQGLAVDGRADLYSLAAVGYEALTGSRAVSGNDLGALVEVLYTVPPPVSSHVPWATPELDAAFAAALAKQPDARPESVAEWADSVARILGSIAGQQTSRWTNIGE